MNWFDSFCDKLKQNGYSCALDEAFDGHNAKISVSEENCGQLKNLLRSQFRETDIAELDEEVWLVNAQAEGICRFEIRTDPGIPPGARSVVIGQPGEGRYRLNSGMIIALLGVDGAGKSTVSAEIAGWIGDCVLCSRYAMGVGQAVKEKSAVRREKRGTRPTSGVKLLGAARRNAAFTRFAVHEKKLLKQIQREKEQGCVVVVDRYPQVQFFGISDGPKVRGVPVLAAVERHYLAYADQVPPTHVFKLRIPLEIAERRRPGDDRQILKRKIEIVDKLQFPSSSVTEIDAEMPFELELRLIEEKLWEAMCKIGFKVSAR